MSLATGTDYERLVEPHRRELHAHCYRMLGSVHDADDALQEALTRAWRNLERFEGRSSLRSWLYRIATNACLDHIARRPRRVLPIEHGPAADPAAGPAQQPLAETVWIEPYPEDRLLPADAQPGPEARYERRESVELAFIAAVQHLPATQRAVLLLREVLGFSAREVAESLDTTVPSVNSALQRARATIDARVPRQTQQATLRALGDTRVRGLVEDYMEAMDRGDVDRVVAMLAEDAAWSMPPLASWFSGHAAIRAFLEAGPLSGAFEWRHLPARANGQPAVACYTWHAHRERFEPFCIDVLTLEGDRIGEVTAFIARAPEELDPETLRRFPDRRPDPRAVGRIFGDFGLPLWLDR
ncbi:MAG: RNA polymerase sigma factor [uncultured Solirubrobacteraceae bacterium]|uniref:RNA polymerase sigma factor n=1 Tax=uncultured Solirubrobacteraceae bacterium TaxID=1162706 RepID=A0A6J4RNZ5_9ACTN|nr:MAG: RNA polymerase sigma factor [uncultured Solirubrobacteraceae bacterium]